jgi:hypothetical protein
MIKHINSRLSIERTDSSVTIWERAGSTARPLRVYPNELCGLIESLTDVSETFTLVELEPATTSPGGSHT